MEIFLQIYDDIDDWLVTVWLAAGPGLWALLVVLTAALVLCGSLWRPGPLWVVSAGLTLVIGLLPVALKASGDHKSRLRLQPDSI